jgi:putative restriction endonuclease
LAANIPPLTIIVVDKNGDVGSGFSGCINGDYEYCTNSVMRYMWHHESVNFAKSIDIAVTIIDDEVETKIENLTTKNRGINQSIFRDKLFLSYKHKCKVCEINDKKILEACHIKDYVFCTGSEQTDPRNGLILCRNHHKMFDEKWIIIDKNGCLSINTKLAASKIKMILNTTTVFSNQPLVKVTGKRGIKPGKLFCLWFYYRV